ncbi:MAG: hypothetical protein AB3K77_13365 [Methanosarcinaceae archaeon]
MDLNEFIISLLEILISFPAIVLLLVILGRKHIIGLVETFKTQLEKGKISSLKIRDFFEIEFTKIENNRLTEVSPTELETLDVHEKSSLNYLPETIERAFTTGRMSRILFVDLERHINTAALYLYVRRLSEYFDLRLLVFVSGNKFLGTMGIKEFIYLMELEFPDYRVSYEHALLSIVGQESLQGKKRESSIIEKFTLSDIEGKGLTAQLAVSLFGQNLSVERFESKDTLSVDDLLSILRIDSDFIPITKEGIYRGIVEKNHFVQLVIANFLQKSSEMEVAERKK